MSVDGIWRKGNLVKMPFLLTVYEGACDWSVVSYEFRVVSWERKSTTPPLTPHPLTTDHHAPTPTGYIDLWQLNFQRGAPDDTGCNHFQLNHEIHQTHEMDTNQYLAQSPQSAQRLWSLSKKTSRTSRTSRELKRFAHISSCPFDRINKMNMISCSL